MHHFLESISYSDIQFLAFHFLDLELDDGEKDKYFLLYMSECFVAHEIQIYELQSFLRKELEWLQDSAK